MKSHARYCRIFFTVAADGVELDEHDLVSYYGTGDLKKNYIINYYY